jgi:hypothetical protein
MTERRARRARQRSHVPLYAIPAGTGCAGRRIGTDTTCVRCRSPALVRWVVGDPAERMTPGPTMLPCQRADVKCAAH